MATSKCIRVLARHSEEKIRLFCTPHAGAGASIYYSWTRLLPPTIGIYGIQLPGREQRGNEPFANDMDGIVAEISDAIATWDDKPFALYGHSLGGLISFEVAGTLAVRTGMRPQAFFAGGCSAPSAVRNEDTRFHDHASLVQVVRRMGGMDEILAEEDELSRYLLSVVAADLTLFNGYVYKDRDRLDCPVVALFGTYDTEQTVEDVLAWRAHARRGFHIREIRGGHFFHKECARQVTHVVAEYLVGG